MARYARLYLICYDISDPEGKRLQKIYKLMRGYGDHLQYSVFRCILSDLRLAQLKVKIQDLIHHSLDQVIIIDLGAAESPNSWNVQVLGKALEPMGYEVKIV